MIARSEKVLNGMFSTLCKLDDSTWEVSVKYKSSLFQAREYSLQAALKKLDEYRDMMFTHYAS